MNVCPNEDAIENSSPEAEGRVTVSTDESSLSGVSSMESSLFNHSGEIRDNYLKIECVEPNDRADTENLSSDASISSIQSLVLNDTSSCLVIEADDVLMTEDEVANDVDKDFSLTYDHYTSPTYDHYTIPTYNHYTSPDLNYTDHVDIATESLSALTSENTMANAKNFTDDMAGNHPGSADDSLVESEDKDWMLGSSSPTSSIEEKTTRFIQNGYLDTVDGMFDILKVILI